MKIYEILKKENTNKIFKDTKGDTWKVEPHINNLILAMNNEGSNHSNIVNIYYLDEILDIDFEFDIEASTKFIAECSECGFHSDDQFDIYKFDEDENGNSLCPNN